MIKNIVFDIGMVLVDFRWHDYMLDLGFSEKEVDILAQVMVNGPLWNELDRGVISEPDVINMMKERAPQYSEKIDLFWSKIEDIVESFPYSADWLKGLQKRGYHIYLLSNYPERLFSLNSRKQFTFLPYTDGRVISSHVKMVKPDTEIYQCLLQTYDLNPDETVFLDDRKENIEAAVNCGIHGIVFTSYEEASKSLEEILK